MFGTFRCIFFISCLQGFFIYFSSMLTSWNKTTKIIKSIENIDFWAYYSKLYISISSGFESLGTAVPPPILLMNWIRGSGVGLAFRHLTVFGVVWLTDKFFPVLVNWCCSNHSSLAACILAESPQLQHGCSPNALGLMDVCLHICRDNSSKRWVQVLVYFPVYITKGNRGVIKR